MKRLMTIMLGVTLAVGMAGMAIAGNIDSPGAPSAGSGMYTLQNLYDYLTNGAALTVPGSFHGPTASPASTMKSTKQIGDAVKAQFDQCDATAGDVRSGKKFFSTVSGNWGVKTGTGSTHCTLLKTGQTSVYYTGDDAFENKGKAFSYTKSASGLSVTDNVTGLMWPGSGTGEGCYSGNTLNWTDAIDWAVGLSFDGYSDWRLPNMNEIQSLYVRDASQGPPYVNKTYFTRKIWHPNGPWYYTSTTYVPTISYAFVVTFIDTTASYTDKEIYRYYVSAVRGGQ